MLKAKVKDSMPVATAWIDRPLDSVRLDLEEIDEPDTWYGRHWRGIIFALCATTVFVAIVLGAELDAPDTFYAAAVLLMLGTAAVAPWGPRWQATFVAACAIAAAVQSLIWGESSSGVAYQLLETGTAAGVSIFVAALAESYRASGRCVLAIASEIGKIKSTEAELKASREAAETASRAKSDFLSSMSHEIRTPMNAILGMADVLADSKLSAQQRKYLDIMINNGNALLDLINDILDFARVESGKLTLERVPFEPAELVEKVAETLAIRAHQKKIELIVRTAPGVPAEVVGDPMRLRQVLINLVGNAIKFTEAGEVIIAVEPSADSVDVLNFAVSDTGIGIAADELPKIFSSYVQANTSTARKFGGTGLGLAIVKQLVELMGGRIWAESELGRGSVFHFTAPLASHSDSLNSDNGADLDGARIMIADDNASVRRILAEMLEARGARVDCASTEGEAVELIRKASAHGGYSLMLLDFRMGETDGCGLVNAMRRQRLNAGTVIPMLTTEDLNIKLQALRKVGLLQHLLKPIRRGELMQVLKAALNRDSVRPPLAFKARKAASISTQLRTHHQESRANPVEPSTHAPSAAEQIGASGIVEPLRVLLADDSPDNRLLIDAFLKKCGWMLEYAENGQVAVQKFTSGNYDVVLMDIQMPVMDGYEASKRIREWEAAHGGKRTPIIALTASVLDEAVDKSFVAGCDTHVSKPIRRGALIAAIREVTSLRERSVPELSGVAISAGA